MKWKLTGDWFKIKFVVDGQMYFYNDRQIFIVSSRTCYKDNVLASVFTKSLNTLLTFYKIESAEFNVSGYLYGDVNLYIDTELTRVLKNIISMNNMTDFPIQFQEFLDSPEYPYNRD